MKIRLIFALFCVFVASIRGAFAATNEVLEAESTVRMPSVEASVFYRTMKIERGQVENKESVFGYEVELEWQGVFGGVEACYDMTDIDGRKGRYNEIESFLGYGYKFGDLEVKGAYVYEDCVLEESDSQHVEIELEYDTELATPFLVIECDTCKKAGALYGVAGLKRGFELFDGCELHLEGDVGFGNPYRNDDDFESEKWAFREIHLGASLEIAVCPHVKVVPGIDFYDYFTESQRHTYDKFHGFVTVAGCNLVFEF